MREVGREEERGGEDVCKEHQTLVCMRSPNIPGSWSAFRRLPAARTALHFTYKCVYHDCMAYGLWLHEVPFHYLPWLDKWKYREEGEVGVGGKEGYP